MNGHPGPKSSNAPPPPPPKTPSLIPPPKVYNPEKVVLIVSGREYFAPKDLGPAPNPKPDFGPGELTNGEKWIDSRGDFRITSYTRPGQPLGAKVYKAGEERPCVVFALHDEANTQRAAAYVTRRIVREAAKNAP